MRMFLLAAAAVIAMPALAQTTPQSGTSTPDSATPATPADQTTAPTDPSTMTPPSGGTQSMPPSTPADTANPAGTTTQDPMPAQTTGGTSGGAMPMGNAAGDPVGGYQPSAPALSGPATPGVTPTFRAAPSPSEAYPAPAPLAHYPMCKPGQFDNCMQGTGSTHSRQVHRRRR